MDDIDKQFYEDLSNEDDIYPCYLEMRDLECIRFHSGQDATMRQGPPCKEEQHSDG